MLCGVSQVIIHFDNLNSQNYLFMRLWVFCIHPIQSRGENYAWVWIPAWKHASLIMFTQTLLYLKGDEQLSQSLMSPVPSEKEPWGGPGGVGGRAQRWFPFGEPGGEHGTPSLQDLPKGQAVDPSPASWQCSMLGAGGGWPGCPTVPGSILLPHDDLCPRAWQQGARCPHPCCHS